MEVNTCVNCKNYFGDLSCMAFSKIPKDILNGDNDHSKKLKKQGNEIIFEPIEDEIINPLFDFNSGEEGILFPPKHPYYNVPKKYKKAQKNNFGLDG